MNIKTILYNLTVPHFVLLDTYWIMNIGMYYICKIKHQKFSILSPWLSIWAQLLKNLQIIKPLIITTTKHTQTLDLNTLDTAVYSCTFQMPGECKQAASATHHCYEEDSPQPKVSKSQIQHETDMTKRSQVRPSTLQMNLFYCVEMTGMRKLQMSFRKCLYHNNQLKGRLFKQSHKIWP